VSITDEQLMEYRIKFWVVREEDDIELDIIGDVQPGHKGRYYGPPEKCFPDEPTSAEITSVLINDKEWTGSLSYAEEDDAIEKLIEAFEDDDSFAEPDYEE